ncbi:hypothetical protein RHS03_09881, partial [Rhizoctonia solani]
MTGTASIYIPNEGSSYFFKDNQYAKIKWSPSEDSSSLGFGPTKISEWATLNKLKFDRVDAILPAKPHINRGLFFSASNYADIEYVPSSGEEALIHHGSFQEKWPALVKANFYHVDAAFWVPGKTDEAYFFSGSQYCRIKFSYDGKVNKLVEGPTGIDRGFPRMQLSTGRIDTIVPRPDDSSKFYVFSGNKYHSYYINPDRPDEQEMWGLFTVAHGWGALVEAGFYKVGYMRISDGGILISPV